jgi:hypothetical protein
VCSAFVSKAAAEARDQIELEEARLEEETQIKQIPDIQGAITRSRKRIH